GPNYWKDGKEFGEVKDRDDKIIVFYSSISTNDFEKYGECVMGSKGTVVVDQEGSIHLYAAAGARGTAVGVTTTGGKPTLDTSGSMAEYARAGSGGGGPAG